MCPPHAPFLHYSLSHRFVSAIHIPRDPTALGILVSGGGDPVMKVWDWRTGRRLYDVAIEDSVSPFVAVRRARRQRGYDSDGERKPPSRRWLARQRRREAKAAAGTATPAEGDVGLTPEVDDDGEDGGVGVEVEVGMEDDGDESGDEATETPEIEERPLVLVVQKIDTLKVGGRLAVVFSAVGCVPRVGIPTLPTNWLIAPFDQCDGALLVSVASRPCRTIGRTDRCACA
jgi:tRNA (guanine-N(7)-)-methyltransferase subunit TRM82